MYDCNKYFMRLPNPLVCCHFFISIAATTVKAFPKSMFSEKLFKVIKSSWSVSFFEEKNEKKK